MSFGKHIEDPQEILHQSEETIREETFFCDFCSHNKTASGFWTALYHDEHHKTFIKPRITN